MELTFFVFQEVMEVFENFLEDLKLAVQEKRTEAQKVQASFLAAEFIAYLFAKRNPERSRRDNASVIRIIYRRLMGRKMTRKDYSLIMLDYENRPAVFFEIQDDTESSKDNMDELCKNCKRLEFFGRRRMASRLLKTAPKIVSNEYIHRYPNFFRTGTSLDRSK